MNWQRMGLGFCLAPGRLAMGRWVGLVALCVGMLVGRAYGSAALLLEEPYGRFGGMNPTGHAAVYLNHVCAETPTQLRACRAGEYGVVISRYHRVGGHDWLAVPLIPYLYGVEDVDAIPTAVDAVRVAKLRDGYRRAHLLAVAPNAAEAGMPKGEWTQLVGSSYDRTIYGFEVETTREQDERLIAILNDRRNVSHFNLFFRNCADFSKMVLNLYYPHSIHRSFIADLGLTTPKQLARSMVKYGKRHPEVEMHAFVIPQMAGSVARSHKVHGVTESLVKSKKYLLPLVVLSPQITGGALVAYLAGGRLELPKDAQVFELREVSPEGVADLNLTPTGSN
ncbi:MAG: hypothetical protein JWM43_3560 [Acidobacteriaceae bacterium]|nr:hypothetical protein [Acidobacteriaceae bacterium]